MKTVLIIKTSSLGDVIHTLPALTDAKTALGEVQFDWVVEENFAHIPAWHPDVRKVIPVAIRRWRKHLVQTLFSGEWSTFKKQLQQEQYDVVIDAQGLLKSALMTRLACGETFGLDKTSARESLASSFYQNRLAIKKQQHAVERVRELFARSLGYEFNNLPLDYGISRGISRGTSRAITERSYDKLEGNSKLSKRILFLHGTTWDTKHWPEQYWFELANQVTEQGYDIIIPWGNDLERQRAMRIQSHCELAQQITILDKMGLNELVQHMMSVDAVVAVDTGLAHLSAALDKPTVAMYGPTSPGLTGTYGQHQQHLQVGYECSPCFRKKCNKTITDITPECYTHLKPEQVMKSLQQLLQ